MQYVNSLVLKATKGQINKFIKEINMGIIESSTPNGVRQILMSKTEPKINK